MNTRLLAIIGIVLVAGGILLTSAFFIVDQTEQALVLQLGEVRRVIRDPGLKIKRPFIEDVITYDKRVLDFESPHEEVIVSDQKRLVVDAYTRYRIVNPLQFYQTVGSEQGVRARLSALVSGSLRRVLGNVTLSDILSAKRDAIMLQIRDDVAFRRSRSASRSSMCGCGAPIFRRRTARRSTPECNPSANSRRGSIAAKAPRRRRMCAPTPSASERSSWPTRSATHSGCAATATPRRQRPMATRSGRISSSSPFIARCRPIATR